ncbi:YdcF family protein [candidate division KSB1 bacterium]|nr:YdcF family protein [candidate division KSB1 bacterium]
MTGKRAAALIIIILCIVSVSIFIKPVFRSMGRYLARPDSKETADIVVVEGGNVLSRIKMNHAIQLYKAGRAKRILILLNSSMGNVDVFGIGNYNKVIAAMLDSLGVPAQDYIIQNIVVRGPYARNTALKLYGILKNKNVSSILLVNDKFHIRRSYLVYEKVLREIDVKVYTCTFDIYVDTETWWRSIDGVRRVAGEYIKLGYYRVKGYI